LSALAGIGTLVRTGTLVRCFRLTGGGGGGGVGGAVEHTANGTPET